MREADLIEKSNRPDKKYQVRYKDKLIHFGSAYHAQFKDNTPLGLYSHVDHLDKERRKRYYARHGRTNDKNSPKYWSNKYLW